MVVVTMDHEEISDQLRLGVGLPDSWKVNDDLLPVIPDEVKRWANGDLKSNLFIHGGFGTGKTWIGMWAVREIIRSGSCDLVAYWKEWKFIKDFDTLKWYRTVVQRSWDESSWSEFIGFEKLYYDFISELLMMIDDLWYREFQPWYQTELVNLVKMRCELGLSTILVSTQLPEVETDWFSVIRSNFTTVSVDGER